MNTGDCENMSRKKKKGESQADLARLTEPEDRPEERAEAAVEAAKTEKPPEEPTPEQEIERLHDENLRLMAELRNVRQRAQREKQEALKYAEADFARELLVVLDDLERTRESTKTAADVQAVGEGVRIIYEHFLKVLRGREIEPIEALGQPFDPELHEAMMQQPSEEYPAKTVIQELARGYKMHGRVIRPSKVIVSSGPPTPPTEQALDEEQEERDADV
jgi:molecular chaperone GrpE